MKKVLRRRPADCSARRPSRLFSLLALLVAVWILWEFLNWPDVGDLAVRNPRSTAFIDLYLEKQSRTESKPPLRWAWVPYGRIAPCLKQAVLVSEDVNFFSHKGFDVDEIWNSIRDSLQEKEFPRGASTITQQLAKNLWLSPSRNPVRKIKEALLARQLEQHLTKRRILEIYLNVVEFGEGIYGAEAASIAYFGKHASDLTDREAALLAASLPRPSKWNPRSQSASYLRHVRKIEQRMRRATFLLNAI